MSSDSARSSEVVHGGASQSPFARPKIVAGPETVINPEGRPALAVRPDSSVTPNSSIVRILFPSSDLSANNDASAGLTLAHFKIVERIRTGGMGAVYRAIDLPLNREVALKVLPPELARDPATSQRFRNEAQAAAQLDHENIARVYFFGEDQGLKFIAFEYVRGDNIRDLIERQGRLGVAEAVNYTLQIAVALLQTSAQGIVHRDIKPSNIIITPSGRAKLVDLGLARSERIVDDQDELTIPGTTLGTFDYISPEQAYDPRSADVRSDIYSLGCTLYHMLTAEPPYPEGTVMQKLLQHKGNVAPDPVQKNRAVPPALSAIVRRMMDKDVSRRYQSADMLLRDLMFMAGRLGLRGVQPEGLVWMSTSLRGSFWERNLAWMATVAAVLLIVAGLELTRDRGRPAAPSTNLIAEGAKDQVSPPRDITKPTAPNNIESPVRPMATDTSPPTTKGAGEFLRNLVDDLWNGWSESKPENRVAETQPETFPAAPAIALALATDNGMTLRPQAAGFDAGPVAVPLELSATTVLRRVPPPAAVAPKTVEATTPPSPAETPEPATRPDDASVAAMGEIVLVGRGGAEQRFNSVGAACAAAEDGGVIELRFNGPRDEPPFRIRSKISLVAGRGFRPLMRFIPGRDLADGRATRMVTVTGGALEVTGVDFDLAVDETISSDSWVLFSLERADSLRADSSTITIRNQRAVACVVEMPPRLGGTMPDMMAMPRNPMSVEFSNCFIRGVADLVIHRGQEPSRFSLRDTLLALKGSLLNVRADLPGTAREGQIELRLDHATVALGNGLLRLESGLVPTRGLPVSVTASNCIFSTPTTTPFISMSGNATSADFRRLLVWNGQKNFYDQLSTFWQMTGLDGRPETLDFAAWKRAWQTTEVNPTAGPVVWKSYWEGRSLSKVVPADFTLDQVASNPPVAGASNRQDAGANLDLLAVPMVDPQ